MRKKSHISLARDIVRNSDDEGLRKHRWAFYLGSILPDIKPSFVYKKHEINGTFEQVKKEEICQTYTESIRNVRQSITGILVRLPII